MSAEDRTTRRTDEIRRRRLAESHTARLQPAPQRPESLLDRLVGGASRRRAASSRPASPLRSAPASRRRPVSSAGGLPPVMARTPMSSAAPHTTRRASRARPVYTVSLGQNVEMRLPSMPRVGFSWRAVSITLLALLGAALYWMGTAPTYRVEAAQIGGLQHLTSGDVHKELAFTGESIFTLDPEQIRQDLMVVFPEFSAAQVTVELPNTVWITVTERVPVLVWKQDGKSFLVDSQGMTFPSRSEQLSAGLPLVEAKGAPPLYAGGAPAPEEDEHVDTVDEAVDAAGEQLARALPDRLRVKFPSENKAVSLLAPEVVQAILQMLEQAPPDSQIIYDPQHGFGWQDRRNWMVYFGNFEDMELKLHIYRAILDQLKASGSRP
ncbi:MAG: cell division protein FtsQ/DivIB, partial [Chloroflexota bacterium]